MLGPIDRGKRAALLLDEFNDFFGPIRDEQITAWLASPVRDTEGREKIWQFVKMLDRMRQELEAIRDNGLAAEAADEARRRDREFHRRNIGQD